MDEWFARASRWQLALFVGLSSGLGAAVLFGLVFGEGWRGAVVAGAGAGAGGAVVGAVLLHGQFRRQTEAVGVLPTPVRRAAGRALLRGPVPEDPETRAAAVALAEHTLAEQRRRRVFGVVASLVLVAMTVNLAIQASPWWWTGVAVLVGLLLFAWLVLPRRLRRRIELLRGGTPDA